ncbi:iron ABC transporter substrate-binding protein, partial [Dehalococcoidia bacterium]|nr:iron ABC transporter substrate-binding protein [Dehalococcoidia bacterium]
MAKCMIMTLVLVIFILAGCSSEASPIVMPEVIEKEVILEVEIPTEPGMLVIYSGRSESLVDPIIAQ